MENGDTDLEGAIECVECGWLVKFRNCGAQAGPILHRSENSGDFPSPHPYISAGNHYETAQFLRGGQACGAMVTAMHHHDELSISSCRFVAVKRRVNVKLNVSYAPYIVVVIRLSLTGICGSRGLNWFPSPCRSPA